LHPEGVHCAYKLHQTSVLWLSRSARRRKRDGATRNYGSAGGTGGTIRNYGSAGGTGGTTRNYGSALPTPITTPMQTTISGDAVGRALSVAGTNIKGSRESQVGREGFAISER